MPAVTQEYLDPKEAAKYINSSPSTLAKFRHRRQGPPYTHIGSAIRYRRADLDAWMTAQLVRHDMEPISSTVVPASDFAEARAAGAI
jgi:predicted DNA-binding transcriptional regulator AlpA